MTHDVSFNPGHPAPLPTGSDAVSATPTAPLGAIFYGQGDTISGADIPFIPQVFAVVGDPYGANPECPTLPKPLSDRNREPAPFGTAEQKLIMRDFSSAVEELTASRSLSSDDAKRIYRALMEGTSLADAPHLAVEARQIRALAIEQVKQREPRLSPDWAPDAKQAAAWTPVPLSPYGLDKRNEIHQAFDNNLKTAYEEYLQSHAIPLDSPEAKALWNALTGGVSYPRDLSAVRTLLRQATQEIQHTYGLPESWQAQSVNPEDWTPIYLGTLAPSAVNKARGEVLLGNVADLTTDFEKAGNRLAAQLPPNSPHEVTLREFSRVIAKAIQDLKKMLSEIQLDEAEQSKQAQQSKWDNIEAKTEKLHKDIEKRKEAERKQRQGHKVSVAMKIAGPIIAALSTIAGAALAICTLGIGTPASAALIIAGVTVGTAMMAYSVADSVTGCTQDLMTAFNDLMEKAFPNNELAQKLLKAAIITVVVAALIAAIVLSGGGSAASVGSSLSSQVAQQTIKSLSTQLIVMSIMSSNALPELFGEILRSAGVDKNTSQVWEIVMMAVTMVAVMAAVACGGKPTGALESVKQGALAAGSTAQGIAENALVALNKLIAQLKQGLQTAVDEMIAMLQNMLKQLQANLLSLGDTLSKLPQSLGTSIRNGIDQVQNAARQLMELIQNPPMMREAFLEALETARRQLATALETLSEALSDAATSTKDAMVRGGRMTLDELQNAATKVEQMALKAATTLAKEGSQGAQDVLDGFKEISRGLKQFLEAFKTSLAMRSGALTAEQLEVAEVALKQQSRSALMATQRVLQLTPELLYMADGINRGILGIQVANLLKETGRLKEAIELLENTIQLLDKLLNSIQNVINNAGDFMTSLQGALNHFYKEWSRLATQITSIQG